MRQIKTVIHVHTNYSYDSNTTCEDLVAAARRDEVDWVAVTDHDEIAGALEVRALGGVNVIVGEEVSSVDGHIIGLFLHERIEPGLSAEETIDRIRAQGGLVLAPHPGAILCDNSLSWRTLARLHGHFDAIEICNAQNPALWEDGVARRFARRHRMTPYVGVDTHIRAYLAAAYQVMPEFDGPAEFLAALREAALHPGRLGPSYFAAMGYRHIFDHFLGRRVSGFGVNVPDRAAAQPAR